MLQYLGAICSTKKSVLSSFFYGISTPRCAHGKFGILFQLLSPRVSCSPAQLDTLAGRALCAQDL
jgi:hypothetical protein